MSLIVIHGPAAVGKMTVGMELERLTGMKLFHNHMTIDLVLPFFAFGSPEFGRLVRLFRRRIFEEVADSTLPGLIFTFVWAFDSPADHAFMVEMSEIFTSRGKPVGYAELETTLDERLRRNATELRLAHKPGKRNLERSQQQLLDHEAVHRMNSNGDFPWPELHLKIDNTDLSPAEAARRIAERFSLPRFP